MLDSRVQIVDLEYRTDRQSERYVRFSIYTSEGILVRGFRWYDDGTPLGHVIPPSVRLGAGKFWHVAQLLDPSEYTVLKLLQDAERRGAISTRHDTADE